MRASATAAAVAAALALAGGAGASTGGVAVSVDRTEIPTRLGRTFAFRTTIANSAPTATPALIAHLNLLSLREGLYVDPEDWSSERTRYLGTIPARGSRTITWSVTAVNDGSLAAYVGVLPRDGPARRPAMSPAIRVDVEGRKALNAGGIVPFSLGIPAALALLAGVVQVARRRR